MFDVIVGRFIRHHELAMEGECSTIFMNVSVLMFFFIELFHVLLSFQQYWVLDF